MNFEVFDLERIQSIWENRVAYNLTESGVHPFTLSELLPSEERDRLLNTRLGYGQTNGLEELRTAVARIYSDLDMDNVLITNGSAEANFLSVWTLLEPGDEILLMLPN
ncbi:MAG: aminotransferase class I/II-fold pyridoxal phosphate-dependent enzyme, partial [Candidatus Aminicenantes bacterium]|nr:aminotransferase class I/II-fold pyridoxal phosphate-dependent enzyme [Candidatus Aminicenantes bacterium]